MTAADAHGAATISPAWCEPTLAGVTAADAHKAVRCAVSDVMARKRKAQQREATPVVSKGVLDKSITTAKTDTNFEVSTKIAI